MFEFEFTCITSENLKSFKFFALIMFNVYSSACTVAI